MLQLQDNFAAAADYLERSRKAVASMPTLS